MIHTVGAIKTVKTVKEAPAALWAAAYAKADGVDPISVRSAGAIINMARRIDDFDVAAKATQGNEVHAAEAELTGWADRATCWERASP